MSWLEEAEAKDPYYHHCKDYGPGCGRCGLCWWCCAGCLKQVGSAVDAEVSEG